MFDCLSVCLFAFVCMFVGGSGGGGGGGCVAVAVAVAVVAVQWC